MAGRSVLVLSSERLGLGMRTTSLIVSSTIRPLIQEGAIADVSREEDLSEGSKKSSDEISTSPHTPVAFGSAPDVHDTHLQPEAKTVVAAPAASTLEEPAEVKQPSIGELEDEQLAKYKARLGREFQPGEEQATRRIIRMRLQEMLTAEQKAAEEKAKRAESLAKFKSSQDDFFELSLGSGRRGLGMAKFDPRVIFNKPLTSFKQVDEAARKGLLPMYDMATLKQGWIANHDTKTAQRIYASYKRQAAALLKRDESQVEDFWVRWVALWDSAAQQYQHEMRTQRENYLVGIEKWLSFKNYLIRTRDENVPLYTPTGRIDRTWLRRDWNVFDLKGIGELAVPQRYYNKRLEFQDRWAQTKFERLHPFEKRGEGFEYQGNEAAMSAVNRIMGIVQALIKKSIEARRPSEEDFDYAFPLESEEPYAGLKIKPAMPMKTPWDLTNETARILNDVYPPNRLRPLQHRSHVMQWLMEFGNWKGLGTFHPADAGQLLDQVVASEASPSGP